MAINRFTHDVYGMVETNRVDRDNIEAQCALDATDFPSGAEIGTIVAVNKTAGKLKLAGDLKGILLNSERIYDQFHPGLKNYRLEKGDMGSVYFLAKGNTLTTNTLCYDTVEYANQTALETALAAIGTTPMYAIPDATSGVLKLTATKTNAPFTVVKLTTMPDGQKGVKLILTDVAAL